MKPKTRTLGAVVIAVTLALTACSSNADTGASTPTNTAEATSTGFVATESTISGNVEPIINDIWAAEKYGQFLEALASTYQKECGEVSALADLQKCVSNEPYAYISEMETTAPGHLLVTLTPEAWGGGQYDPDQQFTLQYVAVNMSLVIARHDDDVKTLTVTTPDGSHTYTEKRQPHFDSNRTAGA